MAERVVVIDDIRRIAEQRLDMNARNYSQSGGDGEQTLSENTNAFTRLRIRPRMNHGIAQVDTSTEVLGQRIEMPICVAPTGMQKVAHPDGELATARATDKFGTCLGLSTLATCSYEEVAAAAPNTFHIMQLYVYKNRDISEWMIRRAEKAGYKAIALTLDAPKLGQRVADVRHKFRLPPHLKLANVTGCPGSKDNVSSENNPGLMTGLMEYVSNELDPTINWETLKWIRSITRLPILLKGILTWEDAHEALKHDVQGIIVSNHGGRQLDGVPASIEALPEIVRAVNGKLDVYLDSGIRRGTDVFKAIALGAKAVFIGRPTLWGLVYDGEKGVERVLQILKEEFERAMMLAGCANVSEIKPSMVVHESHYWKISKL